MDDLGNVGVKRMSWHVRNALQSDLILHLEPWGEQYNIASGDTLEIVVVGPSSGELEIEIGVQEIHVYAWSGSVVTLYKGGEELDSGL